MLRPTYTSASDHQDRKRSRDCGWKATAASARGRRRSRTALLAHREYVPDVGVVRVNSIGAYARCPCRTTLANDVSLTKQLRPVLDNAYLSLTGSHANHEQFLTAREHVVIRDGLGLVDILEQAVAPRDGQRRARCDARSHHVSRTAVVQPLPIRAPHRFAAARRRH